MNTSVNRPASNIKYLKTYFPDLTLLEIKALSSDERQELADLARQELTNNEKTP